MTDKSRDQIYIAHMLELIWQVIKQELPSLKTALLCMQQRFNQQDL